MKVSKHLSRRSKMALAVSAGLASAHLTGLGIARAEFNNPVQNTHGLTIYAGVIPAAVVKGHPKAHPEATMHGGAPSSPSSFHYVIAIFDEKTGARIEDADVTGTVSLPGHLESQSLKFDAMKVSDTITYGAFATYASMGSHELDLQIKRPGSTDPVRVKFVDDFRKAHP